jgi:hypothetical protein
MNKLRWRRVAPGIYRSGDSLKIERHSSGLWDITDGALWVGDARTLRDAKRDASVYSASETDRDGNPVRGW